MSFPGFLGTNCTIKRKQEGSEDAYGQDTRALATVTTAKTHRWVRGGGEHVDERQVTVYLDRFYFVAGTDIKARDRIVVGTDTFEAMVVNDNAGHGHHVQVDARFIQ